MNNFTSQKLGIGALFSIALLFVSPIQAQDLAIVSARQIAQNAPLDSQTTVPLTKLLKTLEAKFQVTFIAKSEVIERIRVNENLLNSTNIDAAISDINRSTDLAIEKSGQKLYSIIRKSDAIKSNGNVNSTQSNTSSSGTNVLPIKITGVIKDEKGETIPGAVIKVKSTDVKTITDINGNYTIEADEADVLIVTMLGFEKQEIAVAGRSSITVNLASEIKSTSDVVVVGYGTRVKKEISSSISSISAKEITAAPVADPAQALQGRVAGVNIVQNSGAPGGTGGTSIRIRGISSINGSNNPLIVLDGVPLADQTSDNVLNAISPNEIESIDVLKDAAAASIYGVRGSNGVVIINTKRGKAGKPIISLDVYRGIQSAWRLPSLLNAHDYAVINNEARISSGLAPLDKLANPDAVAAQYGTGTDWMKQIFRTAAMTNVAFNISGGSEKARYSVSTGYFKQDGIVRGTGFERFNVRFNGDLDVTKKLKIGNSITLNRTIENPKNTYDPFNSLLLLASASPPTVVPRNSDGSYAGGDANKDGFTEPNPVYDIEVPQTVNKRYRTISSLFAEYEIISGLKVRANLGFDMVLQNIRTQSPATPSSGGRPITITSYSDNTNYSPSFLAEYTANYTKKLFNDHNVSVLGGYTAQESQYNVLGASRNGYTRTDLWVLDDAATVPTTTAQTGNYNGYGTTKLETFVGRVNYDYKGKYLFTYTARKDGSSNFGPSNRYATFQSVSVGWNVTDEKFMEAVPQISLLKVRASYGQTGNQNVQAFAYLAKINSAIQYPFGDNSTSGGANTGAATTATANPNLRWEKNVQTNIGIDLGLFKNRVNVTVDIYTRKSQDLILSVNPTATSGTYEPVPFNTGDMINKGIDLGINTINLGPNSPISWTSNFVLTSYRNNVSSLGLGVPILNTFSRIPGGGLRVTAGDPVFYFYGYQTEGIFQNAEEVKNHATQVNGTNSSNSTSPGDIKFKDINKDGKIDEKDRTNLGNSIPNFTFGFTNTFKWKIVDLSIFLQGSSGNKELNFTRWYTESGIANSNYSTRVLARWTGEGTTNSQPRVIQADPNQNNKVSDRFIEDASYVRIKNITLGITMPDSWSKAIGTGKMRLYGSVQNAVTFTKYTGFDPEVGGGVDFGFYPQARTYLFGFNLSF